MENKLISSRWHGRMIGIHFEIAKDRMILPDRGNMGFMSLLGKIQKLGSEEEKDVISKLLKKEVEVGRQEKAEGIEVPHEEELRQQQIGIEEAEFIIKHYRDYRKLLEETDFTGIMEQTKEKERKKKTRKKLIGGVILAVVIIAMILLCILTY